MKQTVSATISPRDHLSLLSQAEVNMLTDHSDSGLYDLLRRCALAVLNSGSKDDDGYTLLEKWPDFDIRVEGFERGIRLVIENAPSNAFVEDSIISGTR